MTDNKELITKLRAEAHEWCSNCCYKLGDGCGSPEDKTCEEKTHLQAADAIEELSAKATPKRVGFSGWKGTRDTRYKCPFCEKYVRNDENYCHKCGQALMFPMISHTPYVPGQRQEVIVTWPDDLPKRAN